MPSSPADLNLLASTRTSTGETLADMSAAAPILLVLLRHEGCSFCRNAMSDIARLRTQIEKAGARIVLGHMSTAESFHAFASRYGLSGIPSVSDPERTLYRGLGLRRGTLGQVLSPRVLWRWFKVLLSGHMPGSIKGDPLQLPGAFLLHKGQVIKSHTYRDASDRPDYLALATGEA